MFFGSTSSRSSGASCWRRQRFRRAIATARLASCWPTMKRSSSETISRGLKEVMRRSVVKFLDGDFVVGINADSGGDRHCSARDLLGVELVDTDKSPCCSQRVAAARADADD